MHRVSFFLSRIGTKMIISMVLSILILTLAFSLIGHYFISSFYQEVFNDITLLSNNLSSVQINGDDIKPYIDALKNDSFLVQKQFEYLTIREKILNLTKNENYEDRIKEAELLHAQLADIQAIFDRLKDENYYKIYQNMLDLKNVSHAKYLYVFADTGVPDMFTYLFDVSEQDSYRFIDLDNLGTIYYKYDFQGIDEVISTGKQMQKAINYESELYGTLFYSFSPIFDSDGNVVAYTGIDLELRTMVDRINQLLLLYIISAVILGGFMLVFVYTMLKRLILKPIKALTIVAANVSEGDMNTPIPEWLTKRNDEIGELGQLFSNMTGAFRDMLLSTHSLLNAAMLGKLDVRSDPSAFKGSYAELLRQINDTLDVIETYIDSCPESLFILNTKLELIYYNKRFQEVFGEREISVDSILTAMFSESVILNHEDINEQLFDKVLKGIYTQAISMPSLNGETKFFSITCTSLILDNIYAGILIIASDITDLNNEKEKAQEANKSKSDFLSRVSHELRTPMNVIVGMSNIGIKQLNDGETDTEIIKDNYLKIKNASGHLLNVVNDVLDMSRMEAGKTELRIDIFNIYELASECTNLFEIPTGEKGIILEHSIVPGIPNRIKGDPFRLKQVFINLLNNSVKFTDRGGKVHFDVTVNWVSDTQIQIRFTLSDTGIGMSKDFLSRMFNPFEQEDKYLKRRYEGTGLGLSISHKLILLMGGSITVDSELGKGSHFEIDVTFDLADENEKLNDFDDIIDYDSIDLTGKRILLVDDIEINRIIVINMFEDFNVIIEEAEDGIEAIKKFRNSEPGYYDLVLMDVQMPKMDGYQAVEIIRSLERPDAKTTPILAMTANALNEDSLRAVEVGMNGHIAKPIDFDSCIKTVKMFLSKKNQE